MHYYEDKKTIQTKKIRPKVKRKIKFGENPPQTNEQKILHQLLYFQNTPTPINPKKKKIKTRKKPCILL